MPKGEHLKEKAVGVETRFSADRQPDKYRQPDSITAYIKQELASDGYMVTEAELLNDEGKPTGQTVQVRVRLTTMSAVSKKILQRAMKSSDRLMEQIWERIDGKVPQDFNVGGQKDNPLEIGFDTSKLTTEEKRNILKLAKKARTNE